MEGGTPPKVDPDMKNGSLRVVCKINGEEPGMYVLCTDWYVLLVWRLLWRGACYSYNCEAKGSEASSSSSSMIAFCSISGEGSGENRMRYTRTGEGRQCSTVQQYLYLYLCRLTSRCLDY